MLQELGQESNSATIKICKLNRGAVKYYFADFVRKGGNPPPLMDFCFGKKGVTDLSGTTLPRLHIFPRKFFFKKGQKLCFCSKNT